MVFKKNLSILPILAGIVMLSGCATIFGSWSNTLVINSTAQDSLKVFLDGEQIGSGPGKIKLDSRRIQHGSELTLKSGDEVVLTEIILRKPKTVYVVLDAVVGGIPLGVDFSTGQIHRPSPRVFNYDPKPLNQ